MTGGGGVGAYMYKNPVSLGQSQILPTRAEYSLHAMSCYTMQLYWQEPIQLH